MKRIAVVACLLAGLLTLVACIKVEPASTGGSSILWPSQGLTSGGASSSFVSSSSSSAWIPTSVIQSAAPSWMPTASMLPTQTTSIPVIPSMTTSPTIPTLPGLPTVPSFSTVPSALPAWTTVLPTTSEITPTDPPEHDEAVLTDELMVYNCDFVNLRKWADMKADSWGKIYVGSKVKLLNWYGKFAKVEYQGKVGYILASYLAPANQQFISAALDTVEVTDVYTYDTMMEHLIQFDLQYPELVDLEIIGYSAMERQIPVIRIGNAQATHHVLLHGGIHGREHMTTWLLMALMDYWLDRDLLSYGDVCYHIIPMVNPDGVTIVQSGVLPDELLPVYQNDLKMGYTKLNKTQYAKQWKANGQGVDLNRNFAAGWDTITDRTAPSSERYRGTAPFSAPEASMLRDYTLRYAFELTISYHATGSVIYYEYGDNDAVNQLGQDLGNRLYDLSGYYLVDSEGVDAAGYKDWAIGNRKIPSLTVEIGCLSTPLVKREAKADVLPCEKSTSSCS